MLKFEPSSKRKMISSSDCIKLLHDTLYVFIHRHSTNTNMTKEKDISNVYALSIFKRHVTSDYDKHDIQKIKGTGTFCCAFYYFRNILPNESKSFVFNQYIVFFWLLCMTNNVLKTTTEHSGTAV